jgi:hypothetical protein
MKTVKTYLLLAIIVSFVTACKKEGPPGPAGKDGNANVISSNTVTLNFWNTVYDDGTEFTYSSNLTWAEITQDIRDRGLVIAYLKDNSTSSWYAMPYSYSGDGYGYTFNYDFNVGTANIYYEGYDNTGSPGASALNGVFTVRLVAVPASVRIANPNVDWTSYEEVSRLIREQE